MEDRQRPAQIDLLRRLTPIELFVLSERCRGMTSAEIGAALDVSDETSSFYLGNVYDKLGITYQHTGTSMGRLMAFCPVLDDIDAPPVPLRSEINPHAEPPPHHPSERSLDLVEDDDQALLAQRGVDGGIVPPGGRGWIYGLGAAIAILLVAILALILLVADDDDDADATATALAALATPTDEPGDPTPAEETPTEEATPTEEPTATPEPTPTEEPTPVPTETPEPTPTETPEPTPTETPEPTPTEAEPTPTEPEPDATVTPQPRAGNEVFAADWTDGPGDWVLTNGWTVEDGMLVGEGDNADPIVAPFDPENADYAVEVVMTVENVDDCDDPVGPFVRINPQEPDDDAFLAGYVGAICEDEWRISVIEDEQDDLEALESGDYDLDLDDQPHTYRLEVTGDVIRLFVDGDFVGEATDDRYDEPGQVGLYLNDDARAEVEEFSVFELTVP